MLKNYSFQIMNLFLQICANFVKYMVYVLKRIVLRNKTTKIKLNKVSLSTVSGLKNGV